MAIDLNKHALLAMATLSDDAADMLSDDAGEAYWRGFILQDRETGALIVRYRFQYTHSACWYEIRVLDESSLPPDLDGKLQVIMPKVTAAILSMVRMNLGPGADESLFKWYVVPAADRGDNSRTVIWLELQDLVHEPEFKPTEAKESEQTHER